MSRFPASEAGTLVLKFLSFSVRKLFHRLTGPGAINVHGFISILPGTMGSGSLCIGLDKWILINIKESLGSLEEQITFVVILVQLLRDAIPFIDCGRDGVA